MTGHHADTSVTVDGRAGHTLRVTIVVLAIATVVGLVLLRPADRTDPTDGTPFDVEQADATIIGFSLQPCAGTLPDDDIDCFEYDIEVTSGRTAGDRATFQQTAVFDDGDAGVDLATGDRVVVARTPGAPEGSEYAFVDFQRDRPLLLLVALFVVAVVALGRWQGVRALAAAGGAVAFLGWYLMPALLDGVAPLPLALVSASAIAFVAIYVTHGVNVPSSIALAGTLGSLVLVGVLGVVFIDATGLTGLASEESALLRLSAGTVDFEGLLLAGLVIGALGVLDDVTITQVSAVWELRAARPDDPRRTVFRSALRIGRDHISSTVNTLVLAYAGASLPLLLLFSQSNQPLSRVLTGEVVAAEIVRTLVGSIGLVAAVPLTTALAVALLAPSGQGRRVAEGPEAGGAGPAGSEPPGALGGRDAALGPSDPGALAGASGPADRGDDTWDEFSPQPEHF